MTVPVIFLLLLLVLCLCFPSFEFTSVELFIDCLFVGIVNFCGLYFFILLQSFHGEFRCTSDKSVFIISLGLFLCIS